MKILIPTAKEMNTDLPSIEATPLKPESQAVLEYGKATLTWFEFDFRRVLLYFKGLEIVIFSYLTFEGFTIFKVRKVI